MDIFDDDAGVEIISRPSISASAASSSSDLPLFLPDDEEDNFTAEKIQPEQQGIGAEVDGIFDNVLEDDSNFEYVPLSRNKDIDYNDLERQAQKKAKTKALPRHEILSSSPPPPDLENDAENGKKGKGKGDNEKERRKPMRLDEARLVGPTGFPQLIQDTKHFRIKGKGHEATDLNRLLQIYQYWTHRMYPKSQFKDTVDRIEKLSHSKLMHNKLSMWRDEAHGKTHSDTEEETTEKIGDQVASGANPDEQPTTARRASSSAPQSDAAAYASSSPSPPARPPSSAAPSHAGDEFDDQDLDELWREMEREQDKVKEIQRTVTKTNDDTNANTSKEGDFMDVDDDIEAWMALEEASEHQSATTPTTSSQIGHSPATASNSSKDVNNHVDVAMNDNDEEMWEISREIEAEEARKQSLAKETQAADGSTEPPIQMSNSIEDDIYS